MADNLLLIADDWKRVSNWKMFQRGVDVRYWKPLEIDTQMIWKFHVPGSSIHTIG